MQEASWGWIPLIGSLWALLWEDTTTEEALDNCEGVLSPCLIAAGHLYVASPSLEPCPHCFRVRDPGCE